MKDKKLVVLVILDLGSLRNVQHILKRERMQMKVCPEGLEHLNVSQAINVEPEHTIMSPPWQHCSLKRLVVLGPSVTRVLPMSCGWPQWTVGLQV